ncbi:MAG: DUF2309 domain-containing protein [Planctomycetota bacterium]
MSESSLDDPDPSSRLRSAVAAAGRLLPAQGPISIFIHHNTLHAFEGLPFEEAVVRGGELLGCEPYLAEDRYRAELARGRIRPADLAAVLREDLGPAAGELVAGRLTRLELRLAMLGQPVRAISGSELEWILGETAVRKHPHLWQAALRAAAEGPPPPAPRLVRHRDFLVAAGRGDPDALVHPLLIRLCAAFLDQGLAIWPMPDREEGLYRAFQRLYGRGGGPPEPWARGLAAELRRAAEETAEESALASLARLGVPRDEWEPFLTATLLALRGWAGMIRQAELRPDRMPAQAPPASLVDFVAVRLLLDRLAAAHLDGSPPETLRARRAPPPPPPVSARERAFLLFQVARSLGWSPAEVSPIGGEIEAFPEVDRRRVFQLAYERRHRIAILDALAAHVSFPAPAPRFQAVFCLDEREESLRRHLEEVDPAGETYGTAGFFGVAMYYRGASDARAVPLCPVAIRPRHEVEEEVVAERRATARRRARWRAAWGRFAHGFELGSRTFTLGAILSWLLGLYAAARLASRVLCPRLAARVRHHTERLVGTPEETALALEHRPDVRPALGEQAGFTVEEMAAIVRRLLEETGLVSRLSDLVLVVGHGSTSLNNPHESAHDCGACGGGRGGPNARALAQMANDPRVRRLLGIPDRTWFVGAYHNSCDDSIATFDLHRVPAHARPLLAAAGAAMEEAAARNAHERFRRFEFAPAASLEQAVAHVEARSQDLAQPRPEYGHATNAVCIVGRRARTRGLFLDRRAFLVSYDPDRDPDGAILARILGAVIPVCAGINLEYYFSYVDPSGYGCHTKLPHNITSLLGVMDGHASDLRTGLPWQMVEIHEPVRLLVVVEAPLERVRAVLAAERLVRNRWIQLAALDPAANVIQVFDPRSGEFAPHRPESAALPRVSSSRRWYEGRTGHLSCAVVGGGVEG